MNTKILLIALLFVGVSLSAEVKDKWKINMGTMFVTNFETEMMLSHKKLPIAARINTKEQLGMESDTNAFRLDGYYRFTDTHRIDISFFSVKSDGSKTINKDIEWGEDQNIIKAGATLKSYFDMNIYKVNYGYSFYHNEKVELTLAAGLHITTIDLGIGASGFVDGIYTDSYSSSASATVPLPVVGFRGEYTIIDETLFIEYKSDYFMLEYDGIKGNLLSTALSIEYLFVDHVSVGLGYNVNKIYVGAEDGDAKFEVENELSGAMLYLSYTY